MMIDTSKWMGGWKVWTSAVIITVSAVMDAFDVPYDDLVLTIGGVLGLVGASHKVEKAGLAKKIRMTKKDMIELARRVRQVGG